MLKTAPRSLLPAALLSALVGLAGCHISIGSGGSSSQSPDSVRGKPAHRTSGSSKSARSSTTSKPIPKKNTKPVAEPDDDEPTRNVPDDKTSDGPHRDQPDNDPTRTQPTSDPKRTQPATDPVRTPKHIGGHAGGDGGSDPEPGDAGAAGANRRPGSVVAPTKKDDGANEIVRPGTLTAPK